MFHITQGYRVRSLLLSYQKTTYVRSKSGFSGMIMDGRDIGSVVLQMPILSSFFMPILTLEGRRSADGNM